MSEFIYQEPFPIECDKTQYRLLTKEYVKIVECDGRRILKVDPKGIELLAREAYTDVSFYLRPAHLEQLRHILEDPEASDNDKFVAYTMLLNQTVAAEGELPTCQDTGTAICIGKKGENVFTGADDAVGHQLAEKSADQTDHQPAAGAIEQSADDDGQGGNGNVDPAEADRADGIEHDVDGDHHGDDHQLARGHGAEAVDDDERGDQPDKAGGHAENDGCGRHETIPPQTV